jgi:methyl-accepting chemotaxis protein
LAVVKSSDESLGDFFSADVKTSTTRNNEIQKYLESNVDTPDEKQLLENIVVVRKSYVSTRDQILKAKRRPD